MCSMKLKNIVFLASAYWVQTTKRYKYIYIRKIETQTSYSFIYLCGDGGGGCGAKVLLPVQDESKSTS